MNIYWLEQTEVNVPAQNNWFTASEMLGLHSLRFAKRRTDWRLGRWTAKSAIATCLDMHPDDEALARIEIRPASSGMPDVFIDNQPAPVIISISHSGGSAICAVAPRGTATGCDLELVEERGSNFVGDFFSSQEQEIIERASRVDRAWLVTLLWSAKESALKAVGEGLRTDTRRVVVCSIEGTVCNGWNALQVHHTEIRQTFPGWWQHTGKFVRTFVALPPPAAPTLLNMPTRSGFRGSEAI